VFPPWRAQDFVRCACADRHGARSLSASVRPPPLKHETMNLRQRVRGAAGTAILWAAAWLLVGLAFGIYRAGTVPDPDFPVTASWRVRIVATATAIWTVWGAVSGTVFAFALTVAERRHSLDELSMPRFALWGALGSMMLPAVYLLVIAIQDPNPEFLGPFALILSVCAIIGALAAATTLGLARRHPSSRG
jgi:hypothetical protein